MAKKARHEPFFSSEVCLDKERLSAALDKMGIPYRVIDFAKCNPWNVPEWDDASAYPKTDSQPVEYWRWEFIRRDIGYRKVWLDYQANKEAWDCKVDNELSRSAEEGSRYNLDHMISPAIPYNQWVSLYVHSSCPVALPIREEMDAVVDFAQNNGHLLTAINPYECFERQFEVIRQSVNSLKKEYFFEDLRWPHRNKWPLYLRMLDARDDLRNYVDLEELGLEPKDFKVPSFGRIAEVFKQGTQSFKVTRQSVSKQHKAAVAAQNKFVSCIPVSPTK